MAIELRCEGTMHGILDDDSSTLEVKCKRRGCGARPGVVILHTFDVKTGKLIGTQQFSEPRVRKE